MENMVTLPPKYLKPIYMNLNSTDVQTTTTTETSNYTTDFSTTQNYQFEASTDYQIPTTETTATDYIPSASTDFATETTTTNVDYSASYAQPTFSAEQSTFTASTAITGGDFKLLRRGSGITLNEQNKIVSSAQSVVQSGLTPVSNKTAQAVKKNLGGDWLVIVYPEGKPIDFNMTCVQGNDYLYFTLGETAFQVCRLK